MGAVDRGKVENISCAASCEGDSAGIKYGRRVDPGLEGGRHANRASTRRA
jgi:hypothetical protein